MTVTNHLQFPDWPSVRDALEHAYKQLGLSQTVRGDGGQEYPVNHWNVAGLVRDYVVNDPRHRCVTCQAPLSYDSVIRCLDCRSPLCERCAADHFGPKHSERAARSHPSP